MSDPQIVGRPLAAIQDDALEVLQKQLDAKL